MHNFTKPYHKKEDKVSLDDHIQIEGIVRNYKNEEEQYKEFRKNHMNLNRMNEMDKEYISEQKLIADDDKYKNNLINIQLYR